MRLLCRNKYIALACVTSVSAQIAPVVADGVEISVGGYVKLDAAYTTNGVDGVHDSTGVYNLDLLSANEDRGGRFGFSAKESNIHVTALGDNSQLGRVSAYIEGNFYGEGSFGGAADSSAGAQGAIVESINANSNDFILRHAYIEMGNWTVGQTWSTFMDLNGLLELNDFAQQAGVVFARQPQVRYTKTTDWGKFMLALENPSTNFSDFGSAVPLSGTDDQDRPDVVARIDLDRDWGHLGLAMVSRQMKSEDDIAGVDDEVNATGFSLTAKFPIGSSSSVFGQYATGDIGHYAGYLAFTEARVEDGEIEPVGVNAFSVGVNHNWSPKWRSNILYSMAEAQDEGVNPALFDEVSSFHINAFYQITPNVRLGLEFQDRKGELVNGIDVSLNRYHLSLMMPF